MKFALVLMSVLLCGGCAHWEGRPKMDLIHKFGLPNQTMETPEGTIYQFVECNNNSVNLPVYGGGGARMNIAGKCTKHLFLLKDDTVVKKVATIDE